jgi:F-type H+-transporting ATPase subunit alpha
VLWAMQNGYLDSVPVEKIKAFQVKLQDYLRMRKEGILNAIVEKKAIDKELETQLAATLDEFKSTNPV